ncbi:mechanosensitive ion channel family protein [Desulfatiglans anilini]|uniref:mechanosensitive ion channel family protein n=1 Tax=Desulfatiglans anilini TaxID=90728 RepID=UPI0003FECE36|nr:mechanosensitive ion channel domain-containing protein [Desulfatiglans anilini]
MDKYLEIGYWSSLASNGWAWVVDQVFTAQTLMEAAVIVVLIPTAFLLVRPVKKRLELRAAVPEGQGGFFERFLSAFAHVVPFLAAIFILYAVRAVFLAYDLTGPLLSLVARLLTAWVMIRFTASILGGARWGRLIAAGAWTLAALHILNLLGPAMVLLDRIGVDLGGIRISVLLVIKGMIVLTVLLRLALGAAGLFEKRIHTLQDLTPSVQVLLSKALKVTLLVIAVAVAFGSLGINLSAFAFIGGAVGVGIGFGLQKVVSNLISGIILLMDKSIKPGDVIEVGNSYGRIKSLGARYVSVLTRDGFEYLIPNEDLITHQVINWSFSNNLVRLKIGVGVSYDTDIHRAMDLMVAAATGIPRVLAKPGPSCRLTGFGDNSVDLELRAWITDPANGVANVSSDLRLAIWDTFKAHNIEIPFPQRDVHIKEAPLHAHTLSSA